MSENNSLVSSSKLNIFERISKQFLLRSIDKEKYKKASLALQNDPDVITALVTKDLNNIFDLQEQLQYWVIDNLPTIFEKLSTEMKKKYILKNPELISRVSNQEEMYSIIISMPNFSYDSISSYLSEKNIKYLSERIAYLPTNLQAEFAKKDSSLIDKISSEASSLFINNNPLIFMMMSTQHKREYIKEHPEYLKLLDHKSKKNLIEYNYVLKETLMNDPENILQCGYIYDCLKSVNDVRVLNNFHIENRDIYGYQDYIKFISDDDVLLDVARFNPDVFSIWGSYDQERMKFIDRAVNLYKTRVDDEDLRNKMEQLKMKLFRLPPVDCNPKLSIFSKVLLNEKVISSISNEEIGAFIDKPNMELLIDIIAKTYGDETRDIFKDRPMLSLDDIPNLDIFDKSIRDNFGDGVIHNMLSYNTISANILGDISRNPEKMQQYNKFLEIVGEYFEDTPLGLQNKLLAFNKFEEIIKEIDISDITPERKNSLLIAINDGFMTYGNNETYLIPLKSLEDLEQYVENRNRMYDEYLQIVNSKEEIKELIAKRFFGMEYGKSLENYSQQFLSVKDMMYYYDVHSFISDERTQQSELFSKEELDQLEIVDIISKIDDPDVLKEIYQKMSEREDEILTPTDFTKIREKIPMQYSKEFVDSLLTVDDIKSKISNGEKGISHELDENGIDIYTLNGTDFNLFIHTMGINNSGLNIPRDMSNSELWKYFENGCSTISGSAISSEMLHASLMHGQVNLGFCNFPSEQIIGMSHHDAHISHSKKEINPSFDHISAKFNYSDELIRKTAAQITGQESKDVSHEYNEVAMYRRNVNNSEVGNNTYGGKIMPDYIVVYGKITDRDKECAKALGKDGKPLPIIQIDEKVYGDRTYHRGHISQKENHEKERESGDIVNEVKKLSTKKVQKDRDDDR